MRRSLAMSLVACALVAGATLVTITAVDVPRAGGAVLQVTTTADAVDDADCVSGVSCTLRQAVNLAAVTAGPDTIELPAGVYELSMHAPACALDHTGAPGGALEIVGVGGTATIKPSPACSDRLVTTGADQLTLRGLHLTGGRVTDGNGGAVLASGAVVVETTTFSDNQVSGTTVAGGAVSAPSVTATRSTFTGNVASATDNAAGGAIAAETVTLVSSTIAGNRAEGSGTTTGGGVHATSSLSAVYVTAAENEAGAGASFGLESASTFHAFGVVVLSPGAGSGCALGSSTVVTSASSYESPGDTCGFTNLAAGDRAGASDPLLSDLGEHGGQTATMPPKPFSPLIDWIPNAACQDDGAAGITTDQRGLARPASAGGACDIGAVELGDLVPMPVQAPGTPVVAGAIVTDPTFTG